MLKYIMVNTFLSSHNVIIFSGCISHDEMVRSVPAVSEVLSAGFIDFDVDKNGEVSPRCHGKSTSLNIGSRPEDSVIVKAQMSRYC